MNFRSFGLSDIGRVRPENEDSLLCDDTLHIYAVADGIGGLPGGAQASRTAVAALSDWIGRHESKTPFDYAGGLREVNEKVFLLGRLISPRHGIGTTLTVAHFDADHVVVVHVGDSSLFRLRAGELESLTVDHNVENEMRARAARGEPAVLLTENRAALTKCVGQPPPLEGDIHAHNVEPGDRYVLCSDGITRCVMAPELQRLTGEAASPEALVRKLVALANERGGVDNATGVAIFLD